MKKKEAKKFKADPTVIAKAFTGFDEIAKARGNLVQVGKMGTEKEVTL
ncbi:MAG TPA: hypothetical protein VG738_17230 [Chitinophagaceae bacterium]|nr:hypothetical protein [Chitinophagaceae bacterium]